MKSVIRGITLSSAKELLQEVMTLADADRIRERMEQAMRDAGVTRLIRPEATPAHQAPPLTGS